MVLLYRDELQRSHFAPLFSKTSCIYFILVLISVILPFLLVIRTHSKWNCRPQLGFLQFLFGVEMA